MRRNDNLRRRRPARNAKLRFLIVCEGSVTEPRYFKRIKHLMRSLIDLELSPGGDPKILVERAIGLESEARRDAARQRDSYLAYDQVWCVFDVDQHERLNDALQQARDNKIHVALSNPCFELWALLHFQDQTASIDRHKVQHLCRGLMPGYEKELPCETLLERTADATKRAAQLDDWHRSRDMANGNPSTGVYLLVQEIESGSR